MRLPDWTAQVWTSNLSVNFKHFRYSSSSSASYHIHNICLTAPMLFKMPSSCECHSGLKLRSHSFISQTHMEPYYMPGSVLDNRGGKDEYSPGWERMILFIINALRNLRSYQGYKTQSITPCPATSHMQICAAAPCSCTSPRIEMFVSSIYQVVCRA